MSGMGSYRSFADWMKWGRVRQIPSPYGVGGETGYTAQEDLKLFNSYNMGEGGTIRVCFFPIPAFQALLICLFVCLFVFLFFCPRDTTEFTCEII